MLNATSRPAGRHRARPGRRRLAVAAPGLALITIAALTALAALSGCSSDASSSYNAATGAGAPEAAVSAAAVAGAGAASIPSAASSAESSASAAYPAGRDAHGAAGGAAEDTSARLIRVGQDLVYTAELTVRAPNVGAALTTATSIVTSAGGYVSAETTSGAAQFGQPADRATATVTFKIPPALYPGTLAELGGPQLGTQLSLQQQAQDVTQQVADVSSQVASDQAAIAALRALLTHAGSVSGLLTVQDQINSEESDLESMIAQQQALNHETAYATVTLTLVGPKAPAKPAVTHKPKPPPGLASGLSGGWRAFRLSLDWLLAVIGAVAPFAAAAVVIAGVAWWIRRRFTRNTGAADGGTSS